MSFFLKLRLGPLFQRIDPTTPPSIRNAAPFVAEESGLATNATSAATSSVLAKRCNNEPGLTVRKKSCSTSAIVAFFVFVHVGDDIIVSRPAGDRGRKLFVNHSSSKSEVPHVCVLEFVLERGTFYSPFAAATFHTKNLFSIRKTRLL